MHVRWNATGNSTIIAILVALWCSACANVTALSDGQLDILWREDELIREALLVRPIQPSAPLAYRATAQCAYRAEYATSGTRMTSFSYSVHAREIQQDRILLSVNVDGHQGTVLLSSSGEIRDFNVWSAEHRQAVTGDQYNASTGAWRGRPGDPRGEFRRDLTAMFPRLLVSQPLPNEPLAVLSDPSGAPWARYIYRGMTSYAGEEAVVVDLVQDFGDGRRVLIGFTIASASTLGPLYQVATEPGAPRRSRRLNCR